MSNNIKIISPHFSIKAIAFIVAGEVPYRKDNLINAIGSPYHIAVLG
ncbi:hypothetical protein [Tolypothrix sp. NIES-4075]|nr:hypothetical protein [Tolypothrix sp. NIES-4075]